MIRDAFRDLAPDLPGYQARFRANYKCSGQKNIAAHDID
jgi:hypothetical protein